MSCFEYVNYLNLMHPITYKHLVIFGVQRPFWQLSWEQYLHTHCKFFNFTSGCKFVDGKGVGNPSFL